MIRGFSHVLFNEPEKNMRNPYPLEQRVRDLCASTDGVVFPVAIFDCCRVLEKDLPESVMNFPSEESSQDKRRVADNSMNIVDLKLRNAIFVMCEAGAEVVADSKMMPRIMKLFDFEGPILPTALLGKNLEVAFHFS